MVQAGQTGACAMLLAVPGPFIMAVVAVFVTAGAVNSSRLIDEDRFHEQENEPVIEVLEIQAGAPRTGIELAE
jgi:hypothetical protein